ncbi:hypothetical protein NDU88_002210 [Pleurodeles waltl]|uniref:Uncharacterized protein n=1 Tax=Pleurodeles waltl TaxID=8319 RepID=A0AAV7W2L7_PLEWA|nr:hypothetical protein NDU88_002210 [Pleurodeles waltl]
MAARRSRVPSHWEAPGNCEGWRRSVARPGAPGPCEVGSVAGQWWSQGCMWLALQAGPRLQPWALRTTRTARPKPARGSGGRIQEQSGR